MAGLAGTGRSATYPLDVEQCYGLLIQSMVVRPKPRESREFEGT